MAQEPGFGRDRSRGRDWSEDDNFGGGRSADERDRYRGREKGSEGGGNYNRGREDDRSGGYGGDYGRWQQGESYGRGQQSSRGDTSGGSNYGMGGGFAGERNDENSGRMGERAYGQGDYGQRDFGQGGGYGQRSGQNSRGGYGEQGYPEGQGGYSGSGQSGPNFGNQNYGGQNFGGRNFGAGPQGGRGFGQSGSQAYGGTGLPDYGTDQGQGEHRGKGPKNYTRSDDRIKEDVSDALSDHGHIDASDIDVEVKDGEVTLSGTVDDRQTKKRAEEAIENLSGVKHVQNNLRVKDQNGSTGQFGAQSKSGGMGSSLDTSPGSSSSSATGKSKSTSA